MLTLTSPKLRRQRQDSRYFHPAMIPGLMMWMDPSRHEAADGDLVSAAKNWGGAATITSSGTTRPIYKTDIQSGRSALLYDNTNDILITSSFLMGTAVIAARYTATTATNIDGLFSGYGGGRFEILIRNGTNYIYYPSSGVSVYVDGVLNVNDVTPALGDQWRVYSAVDTNLSTSQWCIGQDRTFTPRNWKGYIGDVICYNRNLSSQERRKVERYLGRKYAVAVA